ncbi:MAG: ATP-binding protein [Pseudomonadota bacterium]
MRAFSGLAASGDLIADYLSVENDLAASAHGGPVDPAVRPEDAREGGREDAFDASRVAAEFLRAGHRLRSPLNAINGFATMLSDAADLKLSEETRSEYAGYVMQSADRLLTDLTLLMQMASLDAANWSSTTSSDVSALLMKTVEGRSEAAARKNITLENKTDSDDLIVQAPDDCVDIALGALIDAAIERANSGETVFVRAQATESGVDVAVRDYGPAIDREQFEARRTKLADATLGPARIFRLQDVGEGDASDGDPAWLIRILLADRCVIELGGAFSLKSREGQGALVTAHFPYQSSPRQTSPRQSSIDAGRSSE